MPKKIKKIIRLKLTKLPTIFEIKENHPIFSYALITERRSSPKIANGIIKLKIFRNMAKL